MYLHSLLKWRRVKKKRETKSVKKLVQEFFFSTIKGKELKLQIYLSLKYPYINQLNCVLPEDKKTFSNIIPSLVSMGDHRCILPTKLILIFIEIYKTSLASRCIGLATKIFTVLTHSILSRFTFDFFFFWYTKSFNNIWLRAHMIVGKKYFF